MSLEIAAARERPSPPPAIALESAEETPRAALPATSAPAPIAPRITGFLYVDTTQGGRTGYLVEMGDTRQIFEDPKEKHTKDYITGAFS